MRLKMSTQARNELVKSLQDEYQKASLTGKTRLLDEFIRATNYNRKYAMKLLKHGPPAVSGKRSRPIVYDEKVGAALITVWEAANCICTKRLVPFMKEFLEILERFD